MEGYEEIIQPGSVTRKLNYIFAGDELVAVNVQSSDAVSGMHYIYTDYLGSLRCITNASGAVEHRLSFDAWGSRRDPVTGELTASPASGLFTSRGFTGHEHLDAFGLINMNGRMYDPAISMFLSPDPYIQAPDFTQNFNRYAYCLNNPLMYTDPSGEFWHLIIGAAVGGVTNLISNRGNIDSFWKGLGYFAVGAGVGAISSVTGAWTASTVKAVGALAGAGVGALTGATSGGVTGLLLNGGNNLVNGDKFNQNLMSNLISGIVSGAVGGAINGGIQGWKLAKKLGANKWTGKKIISENSYSTNVKTGIPAQADPSKHCYSVADEYASAGHEDYTRHDFQMNAVVDDGQIVEQMADGADGILTYAKTTGKNALSIKNWDIVGKKLNNGTIEILAHVPKAGAEHVVNVTGYTVQTKLKLFGGGTKQVLRSITVWDPLTGSTTNRYKFFYKSAYFEYIK